MQGRYRVIEYWRLMMENKERTCFDGSLCGYPQIGECGQCLWYAIEHKGDME